MRHYLNLNSFTNFILIGESGCGKSEISVALCEFLQEASPLPIHLFDIDETKSVLRSRDFLPSTAGITLHCSDSILDAPVITSGLRESLLNPLAMTVVDVGGNSAGAKMIAQFWKEIHDTDSAVYFPVNPYRPWSNSSDTLNETVFQLKQLTRLNSLFFISNPSLGPDSSFQTIMEGHRKVCSMLSLLLPALRV